MMRNSFGLPQNLGDSLVLRWATPADTEALASFNVHIHSDDLDDPEIWLALDGGFDARRSSHHPRQRFYCGGG